MRQRRVASILLVAVAVFAVLAHICVGPFHAHAGTVTTHEDDHSERGEDVAAHGGSCDALKSSAVLAVPVVASTFTVIGLLDEGRRVAVNAPSAPAPTASPPLFLLHSSLLI
jgi:hypothetical protein